MISEPKLVETSRKDFVAEYEAGRTPNPCLRCNEKIKFEALLDRALELGFDAVATGHYARVDRAPDGRVELHRAADDAKDQSYVLGVLTPEQLAHSMFSLGASLKSQVRAEAEVRGVGRERQIIPCGDVAFTAAGLHRPGLGLTDRLVARPAGVGGEPVTG